MRTSAALSQPHAQAHVSHTAPQANHAGKADETSPFAQLVAAVESETGNESAREVAKETPREQTTAQKDARTAADKPADGSNAPQESPDEAASAPLPASGVPVSGVKEIKTETQGDILAATDIQTSSPADTVPVAQPLHPAAQPMVQPGSAPVTAMLAAAQAAPSISNDQNAPDMLSATPTTDTSDTDPMADAAQSGKPSDQAAAAQTATQVATQNIPAVPAQAGLAEAGAQQPVPTAPVEQTVAAAEPMPDAPARTASGVQIAAVPAGETAKLQAPAETKSSGQSSAAAPAEAVKPAAPEQAAEPGHTDSLGDAAQPEQTARLETSHVETAAPKAAPQAQPAAATNMAVHGATATQTQTATPAAAVTQHVEVGAEAAKPNVASLAVEISARSQSGTRQFDIRLDPPELGRVEVRLSIDAAGKASAHLTAEQPQTLDLLQKDATALTRALRDAGLDVSQNSLNFSLRHQSHDGGTHHGHARGTPRGIALTATQSIEATPASAPWRGDGRLDIRV